MSFQFKSTKETTFIIVFFILACVNAQKDWRNIRNGHTIPDESYSDQPFVVKTNDGAWLCAMTTAPGEEGSSRQHVITQRSVDQGKTWTNLVAVELIEGPEASYAVLLKVPSGRIYIFYNHNTDNVREILGVDSKTIWRRVDSQGYFVFKYSDDHGRSWSKERYTIPVREFEIDRKNVYGGDIRFFWNVGKPFALEGKGYVSLHKVGGFGKGFFVSNEGVLLMSKNILTENNPKKIRWETLPDGDLGLRTPLGGGPIAAEQSYSVLSDGSIYCVYRTIDGHPVETYSRDGGHTWEPPQYKRFANGRLMKHPRAANFAWRCENGKFLYWFHNHGGKFIREHPDRAGGTSFNDRNPAWMCGGVEIDSPNGKIIKWTQPEIVLYDPDPILRISYPDLVEDKGNYYITETQKDAARVHKIDEQLLTGLWNQFENKQKATEGLLVNWDFKNLTFPQQKEKVSLSSFYVRGFATRDMAGKNTNSGFTIDVRFKLVNLQPGQILLDSRTDNGKGLLLVTTDEGTIRLSMSDGQTVSSWDTDKGAIKAGKEHHMSVIVDGGPKIIMFVIDGILNDGGEERQFGWGRFSPYLQNANGAENWTIGKNIKGNIAQMSIYKRALTVSEAIGNYRAGYN